jgi:hypothetical protein
MCIGENKPYLEMGGSSKKVIGYLFLTNVDGEKNYLNQVSADCLKNIVKE